MSFYTLEKDLQKNQKNYKTKYKTLFENKEENFETKKEGRGLSFEDLIEYKLFPEII